MDGCPPLMILALLLSSGLIRGEHAEEIATTPTPPSSGLSVTVDPPSKGGAPTAFSLEVDGDVWLRGRASPQIRGVPLDVVAFRREEEGSDDWGRFQKTSWAWKATSDGDGDNDDVLLDTDVRVYRDRELVIFTQTWPRGLQKNGGGGKHQLRNKSDSDSPLPPFIASFPSLDASLSHRKQGLSYLGWGGCFAADTMNGPWDEGPLPDFDGTTSGTPIMWHDPTGRAVVMSPMENFFVSGQALDAPSTMSRLESESDRWLECGIRNTVRELPEGFSHSTVLVGGKGINNTMMAWGDHLLSIGEKARTDPYKDFVLSHLGYWTDNGAFYYHLPTIPSFDNEEEALKAVKDELLSRNIPVRYFQWDDWWMESKGDVPGITSWKPIPSVFPSGFTDWLRAPLALYAPMYAAENDWSAAGDKYGKWKVDDIKGESAIPLDPQFYADLFANGTAIGMRMFEQDFLCTTNTDTSLTNSDVYSGAAWMKQMDDAAISQGVTLQWCMMNACHALHSTLIPSMTNGRATGDNVRTESGGIASMGQNGLLFYALGFLPSRDNVWTTAPDVQQTGCNRGDCVEYNALLDNVVAVLSGGPYGVSDGFGYTDYNVVMRATRTDGVLLRPSWPLSSLDVSFLRRGRRERSPLVWAAHDDFPGVGRWSYIVGVDLAEPFSLTPRDLLQQYSATAVKNYAAAVAWAVDINTGHAGMLKVTQISSSQPLEIPASPPPEKGSEATIWATAPILPNGLALLGDTTKWATMSTRRFHSVEVAGDSLSSLIFGARGEKVNIYFVATKESLDVQTAVCDFADTIADCNSKDSYGNTDCSMVLTCTPAICKCVSPSRVNNVEEGTTFTHIA